MRQKTSCAKEYVSRSSNKEEVGRDTPELTLVDIAQDPGGEPTGRQWMKRESPVFRRGECQMSCNLDHVLHNQQNSSDTDKTNNAYVIVRRYKQCPNKYITFLSQSKFSVMGDYKESWEYIKKDLHSLERHTNIGICFI